MKFEKDYFNSIPVIDLFAGPGGLGEGFSSVYCKEGARNFDIKLSIEKDHYAHETLELRSFFRQFDKDQVPDEYYKLLREPNIAERKKLRQSLFCEYPIQAESARNEAWLAELGSEEFPPEVIDNRITKVLGDFGHWVLIGGPPCQAYSIAGRSRAGGVNADDHRVYLYKEYLRIIAAHHPTVFVMENVKGLLSAKLDGKKIFQMMLKDLRDPSSIFPVFDSPKYKIFSLSSSASGFNLREEPIYSKDQMYLIRSENYGVPQRRHRVILLGIRDDIKIVPETLNSRDKQITVKDVIGDLPKVRSKLNRSVVSSNGNSKTGENKRKYKKETDSAINWSMKVNNIRKELTAVNGFEPTYTDSEINVPEDDYGSEFVECETPAETNPLYNWYVDFKLNGACNHVSRSHLTQDLKRYMFSCMFTTVYNRIPNLKDFEKQSKELLPDHKNAKSGKFVDRFRVQLPNQPATTVISHISKDGHYFIHYDADQCRSFTVREAARIQTFPDNYLFCGPRTAQYQQVGNAVPPYLAKQIAEIVLRLFEEIQPDSEK